MQTYIALLRGINVSGQKMIKMAELREHLSELPLSDIRTYIQSGNIIFRSDSKSIDKLAENITAKIREKYGFEVPVIVLTPEEIQTIITQNPFAADKAPDRLYFTLLAAKPEISAVDKLDTTAYAPEEFMLKDKVVYFFSPAGYGNAKMSNNFFEKKLSCVATTRNLKTLVTLVEMAEL